MNGPAAAFFDLADEMFAIVGADGAVLRVNRSWRDAGLPETGALGEAIDPRDSYELSRLLDLSNGQSSSQTLRINAHAGRPRSLRVRAHCTGDGQIYLAARDRDGRRRMPTDQPLLADKLQSIGQLAAGIAHEINTPVQFVSNNLDFLEQAFGDLFTALEASRRLTESLGEAFPDLTKRILAKTNVELLATEVPAALGESIAGMNRISEIIRSMNEFTHPQNEDRRLVDVHKIIKTAVSMTRSAWKYVAEVELDLCSNLPLVPGYGGGLGQVVLNLIINASHAIEEAVPDGKKGTIRISTRGGDDHIHIIVADTGCGMSAEVQGRIFDPFFTTKKAGKGTGQGLALAHREITERHGGLLDVVSAPGQGTEFHIGLPRRDQQESAAREIAS